MEIVIAIVALAIGVAVGFMAARLSAGKSHLKSEARIAALESQLEETKRSSESLLQQTRQTSQSMLQQAKEANALALDDKERTFREALEDKERTHAEALEAQRRHNNETLEALQGRFDETVAKMKAELENVTAEMLKRRQSEFQTSSREEVSKILEPLNSSIREMREAVNENTLRHTEIGGKLSSNIKLVMEHSDAARKSAERLADALRGGGKIQGDWGETVLTELLQSQGLEEGVHFDAQSTLRDAAGNVVKGVGERSMRPDVILHLDRERDVIIDAKVSLSAYLDYMEAETDEKREQALANHIRSIENHVSELAKKDYSNYVLPPKVRMNYVIMFVPNTAALYAATSRKTDLWRKAMERNVYIADEQTLYAALRIISMTWRQIAQAENHEKVYALANEMLDRVSMFMEKFTKIGKQLDDARKCYDDAFGKLRDSGQSIPQTCRKLTALGATARQRKGVAPSLVGAPEPLE